jgi:ankyrin repeat protein
MTMMKGCNVVRSLRRTLGDGHSNPTLLRLAKRGKFEAIMNLLNGDDHRFFLDECADSANHHGALNMFMGKSTLQLVMTYRPPVELVDLLIQRCREHNPDHCPEDSIDMQGRTPLHVAVEYGCSIETCKRLMGDNLPVIMKDQLDRTPLHCACYAIKCIPRSASTRWSNVSNKYIPIPSAQQDAENMYQIICALVMAYPEATQIPDLSGKTPIMLALEYQAEPRILTVLTSSRHRIERTGLDGRPSWDSKSPFETSFTITSDFTLDDDLSSVGSCGVSTIEI